MLKVVTNALKEKYGTVFGKSTFLLVLTLHVPNPHLLP